MSAKQMLLYRWSCSWCQVSKLRVRKAQAGSWNKIQGSAGTADMFILSWLARQLQQQTCYILPSCAWPSGHSRDAAVTPPLFRWSSHISTTQPLTKGVTRDVHAQCYKRTQLLHSLTYRMWGKSKAMGWESLTTPSWLICFSLQLYSIRKSLNVINYVSRSRRTTTLLLS